MSRRNRLWASLVGALAALLLVPSGAAAYAYGLQIPTLLREPDGTADPRVAHLADISGADQVRIQADTCSEYEKEHVRKLVNRGLSPVMYILTKPWWGANDFGPDDVDRFRDLASRMVDCFAPLGVRRWEIWNEPDHPAFWPEPNVREYFQFLKAGYKIVKAKRPDALVISGGVTQNNANFVRGLLSVGGGAYLDRIGTHVYPHHGPSYCPADPTARRNELCGIQEVRRAAMDSGLKSPKTGIYLTEFGRYVCSSVYVRYCVSEGYQAEWLRGAFDYLDQNPNVREELGAAVWFASWDYPGENRLYGLLRIDLSPRPAWYAYQQKAGGP